MEDICDLTAGAAHGLCVAYCEAMDCDNADPHGNEEACNKVRDKFADITGEDVPCERTCPCWEPGDLSNVTSDNRWPMNSCDTQLGFVDALIQNEQDSTPGVEGGFAADFGAFIGEPACLTRDFLPFELLITVEEAQVCIDEVRARCEAIGTPIP